MPKKQPTSVTQTELEILDQLWRRAPCTIRELAETIYGHADTGAYATIQSLVDRLEKKKWVVRDRSEFKHQISPTRTRADFIGLQIKDVADTVCGGSVIALLGQLATSNALSASEREELRRLIEEDA